MPTLTPHTIGKFCRELASGLSPLEVLLTEWSLTPSEYELLRTSAGYKHEMTTIASEMQELGADAGYIYRMKSLSEEFLSDIVKIMKDSATPVSTRVELIKFCAEMARLKEKPPAKNDLNAGPRGPTVVFQFGEGLPVQSMKVISDEAVEPAAAPGLAMIEAIPTRVTGFAMEPPSDD